MPKKGNFHLKNVSLKCQDIWNNNASLNAKRKILIWRCAKSEFRMPTRNEKHHLDMFGKLNGSALFCAHLRSFCFLEAIKWTFSPISDRSRIRPAIAVGWMWNKFYRQNLPHHWFFQPVHQRNCEILVSFCSGDVRPPRHVVHNPSTTGKQFPILHRGQGAVIIEPQKQSQQNLNPFQEV